jgi:hypothetical protein
MRSINATHRVLANPAADRCLELDALGADFEQILEVVSGLKAKSMYENGEKGHHKNILTSWPWG